MNDRLNQARVVETQLSETASKVLRQTYILLSLTLFFSAGMTVLAVEMQAPPMHWLLSLGGMIGLLFALQAMRNSVWALPLVFAFTGFMGWSLGPMISYYLQSTSGAVIVGNALFATGAVFLSLSAYAIASKRDFSFMGGFLFTGLIIALLASIGLMFFQIPIMSLVISAMLVMLAAGYILYDTSRIIHGGEVNYVMATVSLYVDIYLLFTNLLALFGAFSGNE